MKAAIDALGIHILANVTALRYGIVDAEFEIGHGVYGTVNNKKEMLIPNDRLANYLFIVTGDIINHNAVFSVSDCANKQSYQDNAQIDIVVVSDVCKYDMLADIRKALQTFTGANILLIKTDISRNAIVRAYMSGRDKDDIERALQRYKNETIIKITATITTNVNGCANQC